MYGGVDHRHLGPRDLDGARLLGHLRDVAIDIREDGFALLDDLRSGVALRRSQSSKESRRHAPTQALTSLLCGRAHRQMSRSST